MDESQQIAKQLTVHVDFNNLRGKLGSAVDRCARLISIGFQCIEQPIKQELRMPGTGWSVSFSDAPDWTDDQARENYHVWLFATGLRDVLEALGAFLDECYDIASWIRLIGKSKNGVLLGQDVFDHQTETRKYRRLGIDKKLEKLKAWFGTLPSDLQENVLSINRARNILVHHESMVPETYLDDAGKFRISWRRVILSATGADEREVRVGEQLKAGEGLELRTVSEHRDFRKADRVFLEAHEFSGVCWTVFIAGDAIRESLEKDWFRP